MPTTFYNYAFLIKPHLGGIPWYLLKWPKVSFLENYHYQKCSCKTLIFFIIQSGTENFFQSILDSLFEGPENHDETELIKKNCLMVSEDVIFYLDKFDKDYWDYILIKMEILSSW